MNAVLPRLRQDVKAGALAASVSLLSFAAYWLTHGAGPYWQDSGLFLAALKAGGGLLPPGYPVYLLLGRPFVAIWEGLMPGRPFAEAGNLFSSIWAALAAGFTTLSILTVRQPGYRFLLSAKDPGAHVASSQSSLAGWFGASAGGLLTGLSYSLWFQALTAEAYALNAFFSAAVISLIVRLGGEGPIGPQATNRQGALVLLLLMVHGLSFGNHPVTVVFVPALLLLAWMGRTAFGKPRFLVKALAVYAACALLPYLYLSYAARAFPATPYRDVLGLEGFLRQITGAQWSGDTSNYGFSFDRLLEFPIQLWRELFGIGLLGLFIGALDLAKKQPALSRILLAALLPATLLPLLYQRGGEYDFWLLSAYMILFVVAGVGLDAGVAAIALARPSPAARIIVTLGLAALALGPALLINPALVDRKSDFVAEDFGRNLYRHLEKDAIFVALSDQENALTYYLDVVEHERPDVIRIDGGVLATTWFAAQLQARYPGFEFEDISRDRASPPSTDEWLAVLMRAPLKGRVLYTTTPPPSPPPPGAVWVPAGGLWKLTTSGERIDLRDWEYTYRNADPFNRPARNHAPERGEGGLIRREPYVAQIRRFHVQAWKNLGDWSLDRDDFPQAAHAYTQALAVDPELDNQSVFFGLGKSLFVLDRPLEARPYLEKVGGRVDPAILAETSLYLGQIHAGLGEMKAAEEYFDTVRRLNPELGARLPPPGSPGQR